MGVGERAICLSLFVCLALAVFTTVSLIYLTCIIYLPLQATAAIPITVSLSLGRQGVQNIFRGQSLLREPQANFASYVLHSMLNSMPG